jgi:alpha-galactosidase
MKFSAGDIYTVEYKFSDVIVVETLRTSIVLGVSQQVYELYRGRRLHDSSEVLPSGTIAGGEEFALAYSAFGGHVHNAALRVTHADFSLSTELLYESHAVERLDENRVQTSVVLKDCLKPFWVTLHYLAYEREDVIEQWVEIRHEETGAVTLYEYPSVEVTFSNVTDEFYLTTFQGLWERESTMQEECLKMGKKGIETRYGTWSSFDYNPSFLLGIGGPVEEESGEVLMGALAWTGAWKMTFDHGFGKLAHDIQERRSLRICGGVNPYVAEYHLEANTSFETPRMILTYSAEGKGVASRNMHRWARRYGLRDGERERPVLLNSWEGAYFDFDEAKLVSMMDGLAAMGGEMFVLDDGWFGNGENARNDANAGLGDWQVNREKLPRGLGYLVDAAHERGLQFGIWVEPEMVNRQSELYQAHPDWVIRQVNRHNTLYRNQLTLDLANPEVQEFVYQSVADILSAHPGISYVKWDCNRSFTNIGSDYLTAENQTHLWHDYVEGLYGVYRRLEKDFPEVMLQVCASGGGRIDYGALKHHHEFWASDNTDALQRVFIQWGIGHVFPAQACAAHVSMCPNHQTGRSLPLKYRFDVAMSARLGLELNPSDMNEDELAFVRSAVADYKKIRDIVQFGDLYRLMSPYEGDVAALMYVLEDRAVVMVYKIAHHLGQFIPTLKLKGLSGKKPYLLTELNQDGDKAHCGEVGRKLSAEFLMQKGLKVRLPSDYDSAVFLLEA